MENQNYQLKKHVSLKKYYSSVALLALVCASSYSQAMENENEKLSFSSSLPRRAIESNHEKSRTQCLWNLGTKGYRASALEIMEKNVFHGSSQENAKLRIKYIKKLGEFLKENPEHTLNLEILKPGALPDFYRQTIEYINQSKFPSEGEKRFQNLKLNTFYSHLSQTLTELNPEYLDKLKKDISTSFRLLALSDIDDMNRVKYFKNYFFEFNENALESLKNSNCSNKLLGKINFKLGLMLPNHDLICNISARESRYFSAAQHGHSLAKYYLAELYNTNSDENKKAGFYKPDDAYDLYAELAKGANSNPLAAYKLAKFVEDEGLSGKIGVLDWYKKAATQGHPCAQYDLAKAFFDRDDGYNGFALLEQSAEGGHSPAQLLLAQKYVEGHGDSIKKDFAKASFWYKKAAAQGEEEAYYPAGYIYEREENYKVASSLYEKSQDTRAQVRLGKMYLNGTGKNKSEILAKTYFQKAAHKGDADGKYYLGLMKFRGQGAGKPDLKEAFDDFTAATELHHPKALFRLGIIEQFGIGIKQSYKDAKESYEKAIVGSDSYYARQNPLKTLFQFGRIKSHGAAEANSSYYLGGLYKQGLGVEVNLDKALELWERAAILGHKEAAYKVGKLSFKEWNNKKDEKLAISAKNYLEQANFLTKSYSIKHKNVESPHIDALYLLGNMYEMGVGCLKNTQIATSYYVEAALAGHISAQFKLGRFYEEVLKSLKDSDLTEAKEDILKCYTGAAQKGSVEAQLALFELYYKNAEGPSEDLDNAFEHLNNLCKSNNREDIKRMKNLATKGCKKAMLWLEKKADKGNASAEAEFGKLLEQGVIPDQQAMSRAIRLYQKAAQKNKRSAQRRLDDLKNAHVLEALGIEEVGVILPSQNGSLIEVTETTSKTAESKLPNNLKNSIESDVFIEKINVKESEESIENQEVINSLKINTYINLAKQHREDDNIHLAEHIEERLQDELAIQDDFNVAVVIEKSSSSSELDLISANDHRETQEIPDNSIQGAITDSMQELLEDSKFLIEYFERLREDKIDTQDKK